MSITDIIDPDLDIFNMSEEELEEYKFNFLRRVNITGRLHTERAIESAATIAEIDNRLIFVLGAGRLPAHLQELAQKVLTPVGETAQPFRTPPEDNSDEQE